MAWRPSSVRLSVSKHFAQIASSRRQMAGSPPNLHMMVSMWACIQDVLKFKVEVKGHVIPAHLEFHKNRFFSQANGCILTKLSLSLTSPSPCPFVFFRIPIPKWLWVCAVSSAIAHMVKQFVTLFAIQYGLTFCLYVRSLYEASSHSPSRLSIRQLDVMSKSWNELLRHWRSGWSVLRPAARRIAYIRIPNLSPIHTADADATKLSSCVASASAVCTWIRN